MAGLLCNLRVPHTRNNRLVCNKRRLSRVQQNRYGPIACRAKLTECKFNRRIFPMSLILLRELTWNHRAEAVMGMIAGRVPGFSKTDSDGFRIYTRPEAKSGGHGVGWSEITPYSFKAVESWEEVPVSIADPGGTEIDAKFRSDKDGEAKIVLAPILRFSDREGDVDLQELVSLQDFVRGFAPELIGSPVQEEDIIESTVSMINARTYYTYELVNHTLISATSWNKRIYILVVSCTPLQWRKSKKENMALVDSFQVLSS